ncbi:hypothetical protein [Alkaliphilus sp. B6464]|nr:hypothetical protein [Alkaliphilus sp. B6464]QUH20031.1 hypothetical protein HYG84_09040 [Alkaliphilus sp. B6464]
MKNNLLRNTIMAGILCIVLVILLFVQDKFFTRALVFKTLEPSKTIK